jgi:hypothetical protein
MKLKKIALSEFRRQAKKVVDVASCIPVETSKKPD